MQAADSDQLVAADGRENDGDEQRRSAEVERLPQLQLQLVCPQRASETPKAK